MYAGQVVEQGPTDAVLGEPLHAYTRLLLSAVPHPEAAQRRAPVVARGDRDRGDTGEGTHLVEARPNHFVRVVS
jgi:ABC-type dipeptide/oligopeptide/nickel transport system ATPase component